MNNKVIGLILLVLIISCGLGNKEKENRSVQKEQKLQIVTSKISNYLSFRKQNKTVIYFLADSFPLQDTVKENKWSSTAVFVHYNQDSLTGISTSLGSNSDHTIKEQLSCLKNITASKKFLDEVQPTTNQFKVNVSNRLSRLGDFTIDFSNHLSSQGMLSCPQNGKTKSSWFEYEDYKNVASALLSSELTTKLNEVMYPLNIEVNAYSLEKVHCETKAAFLKQNLPLASKIRGEHKLIGAKITVLQDSIPQRLIDAMFWVKFKQINQNL